MELQLIFLLIKLHLVFSTPLLHEYAATHLHHLRIRSHSSFAFSPSNPSSSRASTNTALPPSNKAFPKVPPKRWTHSPVDSPISNHKHHYSRIKSRNQTPGPNYPIHHHTHTHQGPPLIESSHSSSSPMISQGFHAPATSPAALPNHLRNCMLTCSEPLTYTPHGSPCGCVWPLQVKICIGLAVYKFFPLVSKLADEIAASILLNRDQVRVVGADAASQQQEKTTVLINLVPQEDKFDDTAALLIYQKFWHKEIITDASLFGTYEVIFVHYPGLPPSPPSSVSGIDVEPYIGPGNNNGTIVKPLGVDVPSKRKEGSSRRMAATIVLSSFAAFVLLIGIVWFCLLKCSFCAFEPEQIPDVVFSFSSKRSASGAASSSTYWSMPGSRSMSFSSGTITYTGSAKIFTLNEIEKATNNFNPSRILGEGGFGIVYKGSLYDGRDVAVKILKRDDRQSGREFMAEVETLSRLHHRNLVKLIGICIEKQTRCLVYELVPNGSVECHLHGVDKETDPLDLGARMKIALGAARGLAYLHEDSNPCVIHRDFKSSNILLEHDFTPKVSDFGLARTTLEEGNKHISTHVMGTFGYLAPECAMTGHLLVKSDVYSYGVVLLELLTGRKPVDLSQPRGKENLVAWIRPLLTSKEGLLKIIDPIIKPYISLDTVLKVAAIASMCVQPEATQRPFMSEVVQALKLVCSEFEETSNVRTRSFQKDDHVTDVEGKILRVPSYRVDFSV